MLNVNCNNNSSLIRATLKGKQEIVNILLKYLGTSIEPFYYQLVKRIKRVSIPFFITRIEDMSFYQCKLLEIVIIKSTILEKIGISAFSGCEKLPFISIPDQVKAIEESAFDSCTSLKNIIISRRK